MCWFRDLSCARLDGHRAIKVCDVAAQAVVSQRLVRNARAGQHHQRWGENSSKLITKHRMVAPVVGVAAVRNEDALAEGRTNASRLGRAVLVGTLRRWRGSTRSRDRLAQFTISVRRPEQSRRDSSARGTGRLAAEASRRRSVGTRATRGIGVRLRRASERPGLLRAESPG